MQASHGVQIGTTIHSKNYVTPYVSDLATAAKPRAIPDYDYDKKIGQVI
jgi:hypothetical protein